MSSPPGGSMFQRLNPPEAGTVNLSVDGNPVTAFAGDSLPAGLLAAGIVACRTTPVSGAPRAPYCMMGVCFECLVTIDGVGNRQGCLIAIEEGMRVETQKGARAVAVDGRAGAGA